jgi:hypothetical protein
VIAAAAIASIPISGGVHFICSGSGLKVFHGRAEEPGERERQRQRREIAARLERIDRLA